MPIRILFWVKELYFFVRLPIVALATGVLLSSSGQLMLYGDRSGPGCTAARSRFKAVTFPHSRRARLMRHMCSACPAVLFYSKSYQRMKEWPAQQGVSWHQRLLQEGKSQKVEASHMCCAGDEKLRCNTAALFYFFPPFHCVELKKKKKSWWLGIILFLFFLTNSVWLL